jgi:ADP-ribosylglycohydrolase
MTNTILAERPATYAEKVYAGVLGKIIGVYLGRPFEGWTYDRITRELGEITTYVHERFGRPLVVTDDDISGTFTFLRALADHGYDPQLTPEQIGQTWLNYLIENRTVLWWGGVGNSTEHTAYMRLKHGIPAPRSGSMALNGTTIAEQIGAQIFIDGWAMLAPGDPALAADLARRAGSVSHDGAAVHGAQMIAAMEALAFTEPDLNVLIDTALTFIPPDATIARMIADIREWHAQYPDWHTAREQMQAHYGYDRYPGVCHIMPNHGLIILALLYGSDDFGQTMTIVNTSGWDTDCNAANVGCLLGIKNGLRAFEGAVDWRGPVADRLYLPTADGGRAISDAVTEAYHVIESAHRLHDRPFTPPKNGAKFHFDLPGAVQGFRVEEGSAGDVVNAEGHSQTGTHSLAIHCPAGEVGPVYAATPTFIPPEAIDMAGYTLLASPTLYSGQEVTACLSAHEDNAAPLTVGLYIRVYGAGDRLERCGGPEAVLAPGEQATLVWRVPDTHGAPVAEIGVAVQSSTTPATAYLDTLTWRGTPEITLARPAADQMMWRRAWVDAVDHFEAQWPEAYRPIQDHGRGMLSQGTADWHDYRASADIASPLAQAIGLGVRVQGLRRYYALLLDRTAGARLVKVCDTESVLAETAYDWSFNIPYAVALEACGPRLRAWIDGTLIFDVEDTDAPLPGGGVALICEDGCLSTDAVHVVPVSRTQESEAQ